MDDIERAAACKIIDTFKNAPELRLDSSQFKPDYECEAEKVEGQKLEDPKGT